MARACSSASPERLMQSAPPAHRSCHLPQLPTFADPPLVGVASVSEALPNTERRAPRCGAPARCCCCCTRPGLAWLAQRELTSSSTSGGLRQPTHRSTLCRLLLGRGPNLLGISFCESCAKSFSACCFSCALLLPSWPSSSTHVSPSYTTRTTQNPQNKM